MTVTQETKGKIHQLRAQGYGYKRIAAHLKIPLSTVKYWVNPDRARESNRGSQSRRRLRNPLLKKVERFTGRKNVLSKSRDFQRRDGNKNAPRCTPTFTMQDVINKFGDTPTCYLTGDPIDYHQTDAYCFDHIIPVSKGGTNTIDNLGLVTWEANMMKTNFTVAELLALATKLLHHQGYTVLGPRQMEEGTGGAPERTVHPSTQVRAEG